MLEMTNCLSYSLLLLKDNGAYKHCWIYDVRMNLRSCDEYKSMSYRIVSEVFPMVKVRIIGMGTNTYVLIGYNTGIEVVTCTNMSLVTIISYLTLSIMHCHP